MFTLSFSETNADAANAEFKSNYDDGSRFVNSVMDKPIAFILMLGAWRAGLKGLSAMSKGGKFRILKPLHGPTYKKMVDIYNELM